MTLKTVVRACVAAAVLVAFALGAASSAAAERLTTKSVRKIAAKVVRKSAPKLSVAHATNADHADDAARLSGATADQLRTVAYRYRLNGLPAAQNQSVHFPGLPAGTYLASYSIVGSMSVSGATLTCQFILHEGNLAFNAVASSSQGGTATRPTSSGVVTTDAGSTLFCSASAGTWTPSAGAYDEIDFVPIDHQVTGTVALP